MESMREDALQRTVYLGRMLQNFISTPAQDTYLGHGRLQGAITDLVNSSEDGSAMEPETCMFVQLDKSRYPGLSGCHGVGDMCGYNSRTRSLCTTHPQRASSVKYCFALREWP